MARFYSSEKELTELEVTLFENLIGLKIPYDYRKHLLSFNGGKCEPNIFNFLENGILTSSSISWFLALYDGEYDNIQRYYEIYKKEEKRMPSNILPIAHDDGGNLICISCNGTDEGHIFFWDHEKEVDYSLGHRDDYSNLYFIANTFTSFLEGLY